MIKKIEDKCADNIRLLSLSMVEKAQSGHPGGAMGGADFINILYSEFLNYDPDDNFWINRDRFFLDPGHMSPMLYSILALCGHFSMKELQDFRQWKSSTPGHPELNLKKAIENTSGPLGLGHTMAVGAAICERFLAARFGDWMSHKIYTFISDGGIQEEISQGSGRIAGHLGLANLIMFYDSNDIQLSSKVEDVTTENVAEKYKIWGWNVVTIDGNNHSQIREALKKALKEKDKPFLIIGKTIMGKGLLTSEGEKFEKQISTHGQPASAAGASVKKTIENLGGDPENPFTIFQEVAEYYDKVKKEKTAYAEKKKIEQLEWERKNPQLAKKLHDFFKKEAPSFDYSQIKQGNKVATRVASSIILSEFSQKLENMIVASADLSISDKTDGFLKNTQILKKGNFSGAFLQAGVAELTMAAICNGIALHGGVIPVCGTFFVFSDYMKPAIRIAALMELPVKYIWSHDSFRVGEDGPTHQPIEHEAQIRLMEKLKNHSGKMSILALRPADADETTVAWQMAMENVNSPTALILSRQNIKSISTRNKTRYQDALEAKKGAYIIYKSEGKIDIVLVANGSEAATLFETAQKLEKEDNINTQVISVISEGLFLQQPKEYIDEIIPEELPKFGLTSGLPDTLKNLVGTKGKVIGIEQFGFSAPASVLDDKLGYNPESISKKIKMFLKQLIINN